MTPETKVKQYANKRLKKLCEVAGVSLRISTTATGGEPDYHYCIAGTLYFHVEYKAPDKKVDWNSRQGLRIAEMRSQGETVFAISGKDGFDLWQRIEFNQLAAMRGMAGSTLERKLTKANESLQRQKTRKSTRPKPPKRGKAK